MEKIILEVTEGVYSTVKEARAAGRIPIAYYGKDVKNHGFSVDYQDFRKAYEKGGRSTIMYFKNEKGEEFPILIQSIQYDSVTDKIIHVDVIAVNLNKVIRTQIPLVFVGVSPAVKDEGGVLVHNKDYLEIECLPKDLVHSIEVDISSLIDFHTSITVGDVKVPDGIKVLDAQKINVATVAAPRSAIEEEALSAPVAAATAEAGAEKKGGETTSEEGGEKKEGESGKKEKE